MVLRVADLHRTAFVTGASGGLGRAFAAMLLAEGVRVWGTARNPGALDGPAGLSAVALDLSDGAGAVAAFERAAAEADGFDLVVNNAGYGLFGRFADRNAADWRAQLDAMLGTTLCLSHAAARGMLARNRGCLVNVSSLAVEFPLPFMSGYNVVKAGLSALSESLIFETRGTAVTVIDFRPGDYRTSFNQAMRDHASKSPRGTAPAAPAAAAGGAMPDREAGAWAVLESNLNAAPPPERAAADLRAALLRNRSGIVRTGSFFQARLAPILARMAPAPVFRAALARYFGCA